MSSGVSRRIRENTRDTRIGEWTYSSLMGWVTDSAGVRPRAPFPIRISTAPWGLRRADQDGKDDAARSGNRTYMEHARAL
jgi:hypothetical protein